MNYRDKQGNCTADNVAKRCKCDHVILGSLQNGWECIQCEGGKCLSKPAEYFWGKKPQHQTWINQSDE